MATDLKKVDKKSGKSPTKEEIYAGFQVLRNEQRNLANKINELEMDLNEHKMVIETLKLVNESRKCFRMIGGVLCERTVKDVMPVLVTNREQLSKVIEAYNEQLTRKGVEINEYKEKHNIKIRGQDDIKENETDDKASSSRGNVLVINN